MPEAYVFPRPPTPYSILSNATPRTLSYRRSSPKLSTPTTCTSPSLPPSCTTLLLAVLLAGPPTLRPSESTALSALPAFAVILHRYVRLSAELIPIPLSQSATSAQRGTHTSLYPACTKLPLTLAASLLASLFEESHRTKPSTQRTGTRPLRMSSHPCPGTGNASSSTPSAWAATARSCCKTLAATVQHQMCVLSSTTTPQRLHTSSA